MNYEEMIMYIIHSIRHNAILSYMYGHGYRYLHVYVKHTSPLIESQRLKSLVLRLKFVWDEEANIIVVNAMTPVVTMPSPATALTMQDNRVHVFHEEKINYIAILVLGNDRKWKYVSLNECRSTRVRQQGPFLLRWFNFSHSMDM